MSQALVRGAVAVMALPILAVSTAVIALADEQDEKNAQAVSGSGLNTDLLPARAQRFVPWIIKSARQCDDLSPGILAAQLKQESDFKPDAVGPETHSGRAIGIAQFLPSTFGVYGENSDNDRQTGPEDPQDAIMAQGKYLCSMSARARKSGYASAPIKLALAGYNAGWGAVERYGGIPPYRETSRYVAEIMANAKKLNTAVTVAGTGKGPDAVRRAATQLGVPYSWGGGRPSGPSTGFCDGTNGYIGGACSASETKGFDCSSLVQYAYWPTTKLPRVAADQYNATAGNAVDRGELKPGDLVFWSKGDSSSIYHVALYYGDGKVLQAPRTTRDGKTLAKVEVMQMSKAMPSSDYYGATRPG